MDYNEAVNGLRAANSNFVSDRGNKAFEETFQKRLEQVIDRVRQVTSGLSEDNHLSILSPQRKNLRQTAMSHSNIYKKSSKSSLLSSKASLQDHSVATDHQDKSSRSSLHDQSSRSVLQNRSTRTSLGLPSLHLSATEDTDVFLENSVEKPIQKSKYSSQYSSHKMSSSNDTIRQHKVIQHTSQTENLGGISLQLARRISEGLMGAVQKMNKHRSNLLCGELLAWTNHIVDMAKHIGPYCLGTKQKSIKSLCHETDLLASEITDEAKSVLAGDADQLDELYNHCMQWKTKAEKLQVCVDATVDTYKVVPDALIEALEEQKLVLAKEELECLQTHYSCVSDVVLMTQGLVCTNQAPLRHCQDLAEELENITVTMTTTVEMSSQRLSEEDINQLDQLGREWAVMMFCILSDLDTIIEEVSKMGIERKVWSTQDMTSLEQDGIIAHVQHENQRLRDILHGACIGNESKAKEAQNLCHCMSELLDKLRSEMARRVTSCQRAFMVSKSYVPLRIRMSCMCWIVKAVCCVNMIQEQISVYFKPVMSLTDRGVNARTMPEGKQRMIQISELQLEISRFSEKLVKVRQRVQSCIQLSTNLEKRAAVRRCLDQVTESSPRLIQVIKSLTDDEHTVTEAMTEVDRQKLLWASQIRELMVNLRQMSDIKPNLVTELHNLLGVLDMTEKLSADNETETLAGNYRPSGSFQDGRSGSQIQSVKSGLQSVHEELLKVTREKDLETNVGTFSRNKRKDNSKSPYKPSASILDAARFLQKEADKWEDENNPIVQVAKEMSLQMEQMAEFCKGDGPIGNHQDVVRVALAIAENGRKMKQFTDVLAKHCIDQRCGKDLQYYSNQIPSLSKQLTILANVQMGSHVDNRADKILVQNAQNLMTVVLKAMTAAESVCVKGLFSPDSGDNDDICALILATQWRRRLHHYRKMEAREAVIDDLGLRRTEEHRPPKLAQIFQ